MNLLIRAAARADLPALLEIERESFAQPHWNAEDFFKHSCIVAETTGEAADEIAGLLVSCEIFSGDATSVPEREILNLAVSRRFRRMGVASALLRQELSHKANFFLEVRESNLAAQQLYRKFGFTEIAQRPGYYQSPSERAIVMNMKWC